MVRQAAVYPLPGFGLRAKIAVSRLVQMCSSQDQWEQFTAAVTLAKMGEHPEIAVPILASHWGNRRDSLIKEALGKYGPQVASAAELLEYIAKKSKESDVEERNN